MNKNISESFDGGILAGESQRIEDLDDREEPSEPVYPHREDGRACGMEALWPTCRDTFLQRRAYLIGYLFLGGLVVLAAISNLMTFVISFLFLYLISDVLTNDLRRYIPFVPKVLLFSILYVVVISLIVVFSYRVVPSVVRQLPEVANQVQMRAIKEFRHVDQRWNIQQYVDPEEVRGLIGKATTSTLRFIMDSVAPLYKGTIHFVFALLVNLLLYHDLKKVENVFSRRPGSLMSFLYRFTEVRARIFYAYFKRVMGGQFIISFINTAISSVVLLALDIPHPLVMLSVIFCCGLLPVIGNLISNSILTINAFVSVGPWAAAICLVLLVVIHKLEYFLNSRIIGVIVKLPMVITLTALIICEVLFGVIGMILAVPLFLYVRHEFEHIPSAAHDFS